MNQPFHFPGERPFGRDTGLTATIRSFSPFERVLAVVLFVCFSVTGLVLLARVNAQTLTEVPRDGGVYTEAIIGFPRFINPLLSVSSADRDLTALVYAGLMHVGPDGRLEPELASGFSISDDHRSYTFTLKEGAKFHDGTRVTSEDVAFTIARAQNATIKSPRFAAWEGVAVETPNPSTVTFTLAEPYASFLENTTLGILPKHIWEGASPEEFQFSEWNVTPVGAGPYRVARVERDSGGIPSAYVLESFPDYVLGEPYIKTLDIQLFRSETLAEEALAKRAPIALGGVDPARVATYEGPTHTLYETPLLRLFSIYLNHNRLDIFLRPEVRAALDLVLPRDEIVNEVLYGHGEITTGPLPKGAALWGARYASSTTSSAQVETGIGAARDMLEAKGWERGKDGVYVRETKDATVRLSFSLSVPNTPELEAAAQHIVAAWREMGAEVELKVFEPADLTQDSIRPRKFDTLLFGTVIGRGLDLYPFWHSSQRTDPGLNIAQYTNITADKLLERAREEVDDDARAPLYTELIALMATERPALFLYTPYYLYMVPREVRNVSLPPLTDPSERFSNIHTWYIETDRVWPFVVPLTK